MDYKEIVAIQPPQNCNEGTILVPEGHWVFPFVDYK
jgi:hypothetical protein